MKKTLSEMTNEELWQLFPIFLTEHRAEWEIWYDEELKVLEKILPARKVERISHIGSTAIKDIWAKPIIDMLVEVKNDCDLHTVRDILTDNGYICMTETTERISFNKGYTENGFAEKVYHLHLRYPGDADEVYFRDYLNENPHLAKQYEELKLHLWKRYEHDRDGYTEKKSDFVRSSTLSAIIFFSR